MDYINDLAIQSNISDSDTLTTQSKNTIYGTENRRIRLRLGNIVSSHGDVDKKDESKSCSSQRSQMRTLDYSRFNNLVDSDDEEMDESWEEFCFEELQKQSDFNGFND